MKLNMPTVSRSCAHGCQAHQDATGALHFDNANSCPNNGNGPHDYQHPPGTTYKDFICSSQHKLSLRAKMRHVHDFFTIK